MNIKQYTDEKYIPITDLSSMGDNFVASTKEYRQAFMEMIPVNDFEFANIVETPNLVKKRFSKNVEIKGRLDIAAEDNDYILALAISLVKGNDVKGLDAQSRKSIIKKYEDNAHDLTIITNWLVENIDKVIETDIEDLSYEMPELNLNDINFINQFNKENQHYSINDYLKINKTSYETGRKALEKMSSLKLYMKTKLGKKFVYKPTSKLVNITKGGGYGN